MDELSDRENVENRNFLDVINVIKCEKRDGNHFLKLLEVEKSRILKMAEKAELDLKKVQFDETDGVEETSGLLRSAIGKARLLTSDKFKQFEGLCEGNLKNYEGAGDGKIFDDDLQGFWDMVMLQVQSVEAAFKELQQYRDNDWKKPAEIHTPQPLQQQNRKVAKSARNKIHQPYKSMMASSINPELAKKREEQRKKIMEMKKNFKQALISKDSEVVKFTSGDGEDKMEQKDLSSVNSFQ